MINKPSYIKILLNAFLLSLTVQLLAQDPPDISLVFYLEERSENGTLVGTVTATDPDGDPLTFSIISGNDLGAFAINSGTGDLTVADESQLDFAVNPDFMLMVEASDGNGGMTSVAITINLIDIPLGLYDLRGKVLIYPNPVVSHFHVELKGLPIASSEIVLYSIEGRMFPFQLQYIDEAKAEISISGLRRGLYMIKVSIENQMDYIGKIWIR